MMVRKGTWHEYDLAACRSAVHSFVAAYDRGVRDECSTVEVAEPPRFDTRLVLVFLAVAMTVMSYSWGARHWDWPWIWLAVPLVICALPLASRRARAPLAGVACAAMMVWVAVSAYFGGAIFLPQAFVLFIAAVPERTRWGSTVLAGGLTTAAFLTQPDPWRVFGWASGVVVIGALLYRAASLPRVMSAETNNLPL
jgi:hypothetical protein